MENRLTIMRIFFTILIILGVYLAYEALRTKYFIGVGETLAKNAIVYTQHPKNPALRILMVGDSTGVGTGASSPKTSLAGLVGQRYPHADITNASVNGAKVHDVIKQLEGIPGSFDLLMIEIGGNDSVRNTDITQLANDLQQVLTLANGKAKHVLVTSTGNVGTAPLFPWFTRWIYQKRTLAVRAVFMKQIAAQTFDVRYTDLYRTADKDPFAKDPKTYYAADSFHPSDAGYADWFSLISTQLDKIRVLTNPPLQR